MELKNGDPDKIINLQIKRNPGEDLVCHMWGKE
jgi:hypothetical protein